MAWDEAVAISSQSPVLRYYRWHQPAITYGYFTDFDYLSEQVADCDYARRLTGGGVVEHSDDLTIALIIPRDGKWRTVASSRLYEFLHGAICDCLSTTGIQLTLHAEHPASDSRRANCFQAPVLSDLCLDGRKVGGGAIRRSRDYLLYQGSLRPPLAEQLDPGKLAALLCGPLAVAAAYQPDEETHKLAARLETERYSNPVWNERRAIIAA